NQAAGTFTTGLFTGTAIADDKNVFTELPKNSTVAALESFAESREDHDRNHAPRDAEHREKASYLVRLQILPDLRKDDHGCGFSRSGKLRIVSTLNFL